MLSFFRKKNRGSNRLSNFSTGSMALGRLVSDQISDFIVKKSHDNLQRKKDVGRSISNMSSLSSWSTPRNKKVYNDTIRTISNLQKKYDQSDKIDV